MAASPALHASKSSNWIDLTRAGDYPILLGESLKKTSNPRPGTVDVRYNWTAASHSQSKSIRRTLTRSKGNYRLSVQDDRDSPSSSFTYTGTLRGEQSSDANGRANSFALVFDSSKSAFVLESITNAFDFTLEKGTNYPEEDVENMPQFPPEIPSELQAEPISKNKALKVSDSDGDSPDVSNPFDYRHFISEAREITEKSQPPAGGRTPIPGSRTPLSAVGSPALASTRFVPSSKLPPAGPAIQNKKKPVASITHSRKPSKSTLSAVRQSPPKSQPQALSKERISDSDEELSDVNTSQPPSPPPPRPAPAQSQRQRQLSNSTTNDRSNTRLRGDSGASASNFGRSPHIVVNDGDLEIDMGSPPPETYARRRGRVDPEAFRSHTGTPRMGRSANASPVRGLQRSIFSRDHDQDVRMKDHSEDEDEDVHTRNDVDEFDLPSGRHGQDEDDEDDEDADIEKFNLGSPRTSVSNTNEPSSSSRHASQSRQTRHHQPDQDRPASSNRIPTSRIPTTSSLNPRQQSPPPGQDLAPTPPAPSHTADQGDDDDALEAALEAAFDDIDEEDEDDPGTARGNGYGLGIRTGHQSSSARSNHSRAHGHDVMDEEESEVSEEE